MYVCSIENGTGGDAEKQTLCLLWKKWKGQKKGNGTKEGPPSSQDTRGDSPVSSIEWSPYLIAALQDHDPKWIPVPFAGLN